MSWAIDVFTNNELLTPTISKLYDKYMPAIREMVKDRKFKMNNGDTSEPSLDWVFLRKYQADSKRYMLRLHQDTNLFTVNIALNDDFEGGGIFYHKNREEYYSGDDPIPMLPDHLMTYDYLDTITERKNNTEEGIYFPDLKTGDLMIHNYTLYHAIAPLQKGTRYALVFFFDEEHEHVKHQLFKEQEVKLFNHYDLDVDLYLVDSEQAELTYILVEEKLREEVEMDAMSGEDYVVKDHESGEIIYTFTIPQAEEGEDFVELDIPEDYDDAEEDEPWDEDEEEEDEDEDEDEYGEEEEVQEDGDEDEGGVHEEEFSDEEGGEWDEEATEL